VRHHASAEFWELYHLLPSAIQKLADKNFALLRQQPDHPSLRFKPVGDLWSGVRESRLHYRALARRDGDDVYWIWIGAHAAYDKILR